MEFESMLSALGEFAPTVCLYVALDNAKKKLSKQLC